MKNVSLLILLLTVISLSSCSTRRGCNGNWWNNRNVQQFEFPEKDAQFDTDTHVLVKKQDDDDC